MRKAEENIEKIVECLISGKKLFIKNVDQKSAAEKKERMNDERKKNLNILKEELWLKRKESEVEESERSESFRNTLSEITKLFPGKDSLNRYELGEVVFKKDE